MKPITDDFVASLLDRVTVRETRAEGVEFASRRQLVRANTAGKRQILFDLKKVRRAKKTISGVYCYVARLSGVS